MALRSSWVWCRTWIGAESNIQMENSETAPHLSLNTHFPWSWFAFSLPGLFWTVSSPSSPHRVSTLGLRLSFLSFSVFFFFFFWVGIPIYTTCAAWPSLFTSPPTVPFIRLLSTGAPFLCSIVSFLPVTAKILSLASIISLVYHGHFFPPKPTCWPSLYKVLCSKHFLLWTSESPGTPSPTYPCSLSFGQILCLEVLAPYFLGLASLLQFPFVSCLYPKVLTGKSPLSFTSPSISCV